MARPKTGETRQCRTCGKDIYVPGYLLSNPRGEGTYCSRNCQHAGVSIALRYPKKAGLTRHTKGYLQEYLPDHPAATHGRVLAHRITVERAIGRLLSRDEHVHHINGDKADNRLDNLLVMTRSEHQLLHAATDHVHVQSRRVNLTCAQCGKTYERKRSRVAESRFCSASCRSTAVSTAMWVTRPRI